VRLVVLREPRLALLVDHEDEADGHGCVRARSQRLAATDEQSWKNTRTLRAAR
jgi:hypothetical protein